MEAVITPKLASEEFQVRTPQGRVSRGLAVPATLATNMEYLNSHNLRLLISQVNPLLQMKMSDDLKVNIESIGKKIFSRFTEGLGNHRKTDLQMRSIKQKTCSRLNLGTLKAHVHLQIDSTVAPSPAMTTLVLGQDIGPTTLASDQARSLPSSTMVSTVDSTVAPPSPPAMTDTPIGSEFGSRTGSRFGSQTGSDKRVPEEVTAKHPKSVST